MKPRCTLGFLALSLILGAGLALPTRPARGCCAATSPDGQIEIASQDIAIVWDPDTRTEHFIRRADFLGGTRSFGFLVPTPTEPTLAELDGALFDRLEDAARPIVNTDIRWRFAPSSLILGSLVRSKGLASGSAVRVLQAVKVAGLDAIVLEADSAGSLTLWLRNNGFQISRDLRAWARPYIAKSWKITAFRYAPEEGSELSKTSAVCMSFKTDAPFFPYRVPSDNLSRRAGQNLLRVHFIGPERVEAALDAPGETWHGELNYARSRDDLAALLGPSDAFSWPKAGWLTSFEDRFWPGSDRADLVFTKSAAQEPFHRVIEKKETRDIPVPLELIPFIVVIGLVIALRRRARAKAAAES